MEEKPFRYEDMLSLPHPVSKTRKRMSQWDRAAQFSPFAALVGYDAAIREEARRTEKRRQPAEDALAALNRKFARLAEQVKKTPPVEVTWFREDDRKEGGEYVTSRGLLTAISPRGQWLELDRDIRIAFSDVWELELPASREE